VVSPATEIPIVIGSRYPWCRAVITPDAEMIACLGVSKKWAARSLKQTSFIIHHWGQAKAVRAPEQDGDNTTM